jgi:hypothetical protein
MKLKHLLGNLNRAQHTLGFRIGATALVALVTILLDIWRLVDGWRGAREAEGDLAIARFFDTVFLHPIADVAREPAGTFIYATAAVALVATVVIWLGQALTYIGLVLIAVVVGGTLLAFEPTSAVGQFVIAASLLAMAFAILKAGMRMLLSLPWQPLAIARNVLDEAVRMKISIIFIVLLVLGLGLLPQLMDEGQPLRYRIQTLLQWGTGGAFTIMAVLTAVLSIATVAFEQRDRQIWQVVSKPITRANYLLGKWIGVMALNVVLIGVMGSAVFLFTKYLAAQPASDPYDAYAVREIVLTARKGIEPAYDDPNDREMLGLINNRFRGFLQSNAPIVDQQPIGYLSDEITRYLDEATTDSQRDLARERKLYQYAVVSRTANQIMEELRALSRTVDPAFVGQFTRQFQGRQFRFDGLDELDENARSVVLRYKINSGSNMPGAVYELTFIFPRSNRYVVESSALGQTQTVEIPVSEISDDGVLEFAVVHGNYQTARSSSDRSITFPPDGLELMYTVGNFEGNYLRVMVVQWVKLGLLAALGIAAATFMSFPVASLFTFVGLFAAESSGFLKESLQYFTTHEKTGLEYGLAIVIRLIGHAVTWLFGPYADLRPTTRLVEGRIIPWSDVLSGMAVITVAIALIGLVGWSIFRRRELATYSGH